MSPNGAIKIQNVVLSPLPDDGYVERLKQQCDSVRGADIVIKNPRPAHTLGEQLDTQDWYKCVEKVPVKP